MCQKNLFNFHETKEIYKFKVFDNQKNLIPLSNYRGKVLLIVNVASAWGFTNSNYESLQKLYKKYQKKGLEILAFPCNQFGQQENGSNEEISNFVKNKFQVTFKIFDKIEVNGENANPLFEFLKKNVKTNFYLFKTERIFWNFTKVFFLLLLIIFDSFWLIKMEILFWDLNQQLIQ